MTFLKKIWAAISQPKAPLGRDFNILISAAVIISVSGLVMVTSASSVVSVKDNGSAYGLAQKQLAAFIVGLGLMWVISKLKITVIRAFTYVVLFLTLGLLVLVLLIGREVAGQKNWIPLAGFNLQPSEFAKLAMVLFCAHWISYQLKRKASFALILSGPIVISGIIVVLVLAEKDMGTPFILGGIFLGILFAAGVKKRHMAIIGTLAFLAVTGASVMGPAYRLNRFKAWFSPESFPETYGYQLLHGQYALASGGIFGKGLGHSTEKWGALPAAHTDFILAVVGEELGILGTLGVMLLLTVIMWMGIRIAERTTDDFSRLLAFGVVVWIGVQTIVNVGAIVRALPITGVPLPFISYGGSSLIPAMAAVGVLLSIARTTSARTAGARRSTNEVE